MKRLFCLLVVAIMSCMARAQDKDAAKGNDSATGAPSAKQSPEMKKLVDTFTGRWKTTTTVFKGDWFPVDGTAVGHADIHAGPAGNSVMEQFRSQGITGNFAGHGVYWWDAEAHAYKGIWCDTMDPRGCGPVGDGKWEGSNLIYNNEMALPNGKLQVRETFSNITKNSYDFMIEAASAGGSMKKMMAIKYERPSSKETPAPDANPHSGK